MLVGDYDKSIVYGEKALDTYKALNNGKRAHSVYLNLAGCYLEIDQIEKCKQYIDRASEILKMLTDKEASAQQKSIEAKYYFYNGKYSAAIDKLEESKEMDEQLGLKDMVADDLRNIAICYKRLKKYELAESHLKQALAIFQELDHINGMLKVYSKLATIPTKEGTQYYEAKTLECEKNLSKRGLSYMLHESYLE
ncbi:MAG: tetratricopeptide repeat protein [Nitrososphaeraceae archaeon]